MKQILQHMVKSLHYTVKEFINSEYLLKRLENNCLTLFLAFYLPCLDQQTFLDLKFLTFHVQHNKLRRYIVPSRHKYEKREISRF